MRQMVFTAEEKIDELLSILDKDIEHIHCTLSRLNELRGLVIKRDERALAELLEVIRIEAEGYSSNESKRLSVCDSLSRLLGCSLEQMTLSRLIDVLPAYASELINEKRTNLCELIEELKKEYSSTVMLVWECAKFNNLLLEFIFGLDRGGAVTYGSNGATRQHSKTGFVNMQF